MVDFVPDERATPIRQASTANFLINTSDRINFDGSSAGNFLITKQQSLLNGFFTRLAVTELALNWNIPNIYSQLAYPDTSNNYVTFDICGATVQRKATVTFLTGSYFPGEFLNTLVSRYNNLPSATRDSTTIAVTSTGSQYTLTMTGGTFRFIIADNVNSAMGGFFPKVLPAAPRVSSYTYQTSAFLLAGATPTSSWQRFGVQGAPPRYLDFVCSQLTYNQSLKDGTTGDFDKDVLLRYYMAYDNDSTQVDSLGFPLTLGYKPFYTRRTYNPPKQIRWTANQPVGSLKFEVYDDLGNLYDYPGFDWYMTVQVSEV